MRRENDRVRDRESGVGSGAGYDAEIEYEPDFAEEHTPSESDPPNARASDGMPDERWDKPTEV
ncbi:hypothetical protein [Microtetraspora sp. NBRC 16547]|uniref:hypothetical protein n=1 Tax=Microtetraspora sp. NBRC 16547 TaxID=3030993 RepID=UPI0024A35CAA|nr:hypothetical protein [Microtetraspora sp. NBRC 16547]GLX00154.1 hypothetical protein Misp02_42400 [Microtetraspora sp. NBRC 16547]